MINCDCVIIFIALNDNISECAGDIDFVYTLSAKNRRRCTAILNTEMVYVGVTVNDGTKNKTFCSDLVVTLTAKDGRLRDPSQIDFVDIGIAVDEAKGNVSCSGGKYIITLTTLEGILRNKTRKILKSYGVSRSLSTKENRLANVLNQDGVNPGCPNERVRSCAGALNG